MLQKVDVTVLSTAICLQPLFLSSRNCPVLSKRLSSIHIDLGLQFYLPIKRSVDARSTRQTTIFVLQYSAKIQLFLFHSYKHKTILWRIAQFCVNSWLYSVNETLRSSSAKYHFSQRHPVTSAIG